MTIIGVVFGLTAMMVAVILVIGNVGTGKKAGKERRKSGRWEAASGEINELCANILLQKNVLIAGTVGSGKSTLEKAILHTGFTVGITWAYIDFKRCELYEYSHAPNCMGYAEDKESAIALLRDCVNVMMDRYCRMRAQGLRKTTEQPIWIVVDETAEFVSICGKEGLELLSQIGRMGRAAEIHMLLCTQNPSRTRGGGLPSEVQQNVTAAVALRCRSAIESRQIIGVAGAERLPQYGKGIYWTDKGISTVDIPFVSDDEVYNRLQEVRYV